MNHYGSKDYWNERYKGDLEPFEWYQSYDNLRPHLMQILQKYNNPSVLVLGCGTSRLSESLYNDGITRITNIDYSEICINQMREKYSNFAEMKFLTMDCLDLDFDSSCFDVVLDKGTLDSILCGMNAQDNSMRALKEVRRVLKPGGIYLCISYGMPEYRINFLGFEGCNWEIDAVQVLKELEGEEEFGKVDESEKQYHYIYQCKT